MALVNYHDACVYEADVELLANPAWLNDACINFVFRWLEHDTFKGRPEFLFMDPAVVSCLMIQCEDDDEVFELAEGLELSARSLTFIPVNNSLTFNTQSMHWSLLVYSHVDTEFRHYDSSGGMNSEPASATAQKFWTGLQARQTAPCPAVTAVPTPQQQNGYDCGMHTVMMAELLALHSERQPKTEEAEEALAPERIKAKREELATRIRGLRTAQ